MISSILSNDLAYAITWTLIHTIWQVSLVAILLTLVLKITNKTKSIYRYNIGLAALFLVILMSMITFTGYYVGNEPLDLISSSLIYQQEGPFTSTPESGVNSIFSSIEIYSPLIVNIWVIGALLFLLKIAGGFLYVKNLVKKAKLDNNFLKKTLNRLHKDFNISRTIIIKESSNITTPMVMGYIKPIILFPVGLVNQLSISEVESILSHELAHIKRHDYIFNLIQMLVESIFYYHPGIWFISSRINIERENCCDDMAIGFTGNNISYAKTLVKLQDLKRTGNYSPALAYSGNKNVFTQRIMRILNQSSTGNPYRDKLLAIVLVFASLFLGANNWNNDSDNKFDSPDIYYIDDCPQSVGDIKYYLDTIPEKNSFHIKKMTDKKAVEMEMENGTITKLKIDGKEVDKKEYDKHKGIIKELSPNADKDIITVFPNCDDDLGKVYLLESLHGNTIKLDSILNSVDLKELKELENYWTGQDSEVLRLNEILLDSIRGGMKHRLFPYSKKSFEAYNIDSIMDLLPEKMPRIAVFPSDTEEDYKVIIDLKRALEEDLQEESESIILELKNMKELDREFGIKKGLIEREIKENIKSNLGEREYEIILRGKKALESELRNNEEDIIIELKRNLERSQDLLKEDKMNLERDMAKIYRNSLELKFPSHSDKENGFEFFFDNGRGDAEFLERKIASKGLFFDKKNKVSDYLFSELLKDQLIQSDESNKIELSHKHLKINGDKQPKNIFTKYKKLYEKHSGLELTKGSKLKFILEPEEEIEEDNIFEIRVR